MRKGAAAHEVFNAVRERIRGAGPRRGPGASRGRSTRKAAAGEIGSCPVGAAYEKRRARRRFISTRKWSRQGAAAALPLPGSAAARHAAQPDLSPPAVEIIRDYLDSRGFLEIETPILIKSTPEGGARLCRAQPVHPACSTPCRSRRRQLKQLLMVAGYERYFQIARCFRDADLRADRQPEFTQLDLEMSFVEREDIIGSLSRSTWNSSRS